MICNSSKKDSPTRPSRKMRARESRNSLFRGKKEDFNFQFFAFNIFSLGKANAALRRIIMSRSDTQHQVSIHRQQNSNHTAAPKSESKTSTLDSADKLHATQNALSIQLYVKSAYQEQHSSKNNRRPISINTLRVILPLRCQFPVMSHSWV